jgi:hypothetical protein
MKRENKKVGRILRKPVLATSNVSPLLVCIKIIHSRRHLLIMIIIHDFYAFIYYRLFII